MLNIRQQSLPDFNQSGVDTKQTITDHLDNVGRIYTPKLLLISQMRSLVFNVRFLSSSPDDFIVHQEYLSQSSISKNE